MPECPGCENVSDALDRAGDGSLSWVSAIS